MNPNTADTTDTPVFYLTATDTRFFAALWTAATDAERAACTALLELHSSSYSHHMRTLSEQAMHSADVGFQLTQLGWRADIGLAPLLAAHAQIAAAQQDIEHARNATWLRLTPVHWVAGRDHVTVQRFYGDMMAAQDREDVQSLVTLITPWLAELGWELFTCADTDTDATLFVRAANDFDYQAPSLAFAQSDILEAFLPSGADLKRWQTLQTELQMLLFTHPINQNRSARGARTINGFWLDQTARADQFVTQDLDKIAALNERIPSISFDSSLSDLNRAFEPLAHSLHAGKNARLTILSDSPTACVHEFSFTPRGFWEKLEQKLRAIFKPKAAEKTSPFDWLTQHCCEENP